MLTFFFSLSEDSDKSEESEYEKSSSSAESGISEELSESENTGKPRKTRWGKGPSLPRGPVCLWITHLPVLTRSLFPSVERPPKRTRRSREVTSRRRRRDAGSKFRSPPPATRRCLKCCTWQRSQKVLFSHSCWSWVHIAHFSGHAWQTECCLNSTLKHFLKIIEGRINHRKYFIFPPGGWRSESSTWRLISTEWRGRWWPARRRGPQRPQKNPQNPEGRQVADRDQGRSERGGGEEETHSWEGGTEEEAQRGKRVFCRLHLFTLCWLFAAAPVQDPPFISVGDRVGNDKETCWYSELPSGSRIFFFNSSLSLWRRGNEPKWNGGFILRSYHRFR